MPKKVVVTKVSLVNIMDSIPKIILLGVSTDKALFKIQHKVELSMIKINV